MNQKTKMKKKKMILKQKNPRKDLIYLTNQKIINQKVIEIYSEIIKIVMIDT